MSQNVIYDGKSDEVAHIDNYDVSVEQMYFLLDSYFEAVCRILFFIRIYSANVD